MKAATPTRKFQLFPLIVSLAITLAIGIIASMFTRPEIDGWYRTLNKPAFTPPDWAFPIAWTTLYILIATAAYIIWQKRDGSVTFKTTAVIYAVQLLLNFSWSVVFFGSHNIFGGLVIIIGLLIFIVLNISWFGRFSMAAAWLLVPYLLWVSYATLLNISIYIFNK